MFPRKRSITWFNNCVENIIGCRLDRIYLPSILKDSLDCCNVVPFTFSDHDFVLSKLNLNISITFGKSYWKLNSSIFEDEEFVSSLNFIEKSYSVQIVFP